MPMLRRGDIAECVAAMAEGIKSYKFPHIFSLCSKHPEPLSHS